MSSVIFLIDIRINKNSEFETLLTVFITLLFSPSYQLSCASTKNGRGKLRFFNFSSNMLSIWKFGSKADGQFEVHYLTSKPSALYISNYLVIENLHSISF